MSAPPVRQSRTAPPSWTGLVLAALLVVAILFGGGGADGPLNNGIVEAAAAVVLLLLAVRHFSGARPLPKQAIGPLWILIGLLLIIAAQLIPLPFSWWSSLPGRELAGSAIALTPYHGEWRPMSLDPEATRRFCAGLLVPAAVLLGVLGASQREAVLLLWALVSAACISALIGALQLVLDYPAMLTFYEGARPGAAGVFANENHHSGLLLSALIGAGLLIRLAAGHTHARDLKGVHLAWIGVAFLTVMTLATGARTGTALLLLAVPICVTIALGLRSQLLWLSTLAALVFVIVVVLLFYPSANALALRQSFLFGDDYRYAMLPDVILTLKQYWPWGSGFGTFVPVFAANENLDTAVHLRVNHAHNDLLEWLIESGLPGAVWLILVVAGTAWWVFRQLLKHRGRRDNKTAIIPGGLFILTVLALQSLLDYPLRTDALAATAALAIGLMFAPLRETTQAQSRAQLRRWPVALAVVIGLFIGLQTVRMRVSEAAVGDMQGALSVAARPQNGVGLALAAEAQLAAGNRAEGRRLAYDAVGRAPLTARGVRVLAMASPLGSREGVAAWQVASAMGWRDASTQYWAMRQALFNREYEIAAVRADALMRIHRGSGHERFVRNAAANPRFRAQLLTRLRLRPAWRERFLSLASAKTASEVQAVVAMLQELAQGESKPTLREARSAIAVLIKLGDYGQAWQLYKTIRGKLPVNSLIDDMGFDRTTEEYARDTTAFDWRIARARGATATVEQSDRRMLLIDTDGERTYRAAFRHVPLAPGVYRLQYLIRGAAQSPEAVGIAVRCAGSRTRLGSSPSTPLGTRGLEQRQFTFRVVEECPLTIVAFETQAVGYPAQAEFDNVQLMRVSN